MQPISITSKSPVHISSVCRFHSIIRFVIFVLQHLQSLFQRVGVGNAHEGAVFQDGHAFISFLMVNFSRQNPLVARVFGRLSNPIFFDGFQTGRTFFATLMQGENGKTARNRTLRNMKKSSQPTEKFVGWELFQLPYIMNEWGRAWSYRKIIPGSHSEYFYPKDQWLQ